MRQSEIRNLQSGICNSLAWHVAVLATTLCAASPNTVASQQAPLLIRGGHLFDGTRDTLIPNVGLVIIAGKFFEVGVDVSQSDMSGAQVVELGNDDYIMPGMFDLHAHYAVDLFGRGRVDDTTAYPVVFLANGVTSTFPAGEVSPQRMRRLRFRINRGDGIGPRIFSSGPYFGSWRQGWDRDATVEDIYAEVDSLAAAGVAGFKAKGITPDHLRALIARAHLHGLTVTGHLGSGVEALNPLTHQFEVFVDWPCGRLFVGDLPFDLL